MRLTLMKTNPRECGCLFLVICVFQGLWTLANGQGPSSCCSQTSGSCRRACEKISLVKIATDYETRRHQISTLETFCSSDLIPFWECINQTLEGIDKGSGWSGRLCCSLPQSGRCQIGCLQAQDKEGLLPSCRQSDEIAFFGCIEKQEYADHCCSQAQNLDCHLACREIFGATINGTVTRHLRNSVHKKCSQISPQVMTCLKNFTRTKQVDNPTENLHCCDKSGISKCRQSCRRILRSKKTDQEIVDGLILSGCGTPLPHDRLWQCFLRSSFKNKKQGQGHGPEQGKGIGQGLGQGQGQGQLQGQGLGQEMSIHSKGDAQQRVGTYRLSLDSAKLGCCSKAATTACQQLCVKTFSEDWNESWDAFDRLCQYRASETKMLRCLEDAEEPCRLGCKGLSFCSAFNDRPLELFRSCTRRADLAAKRDFESWKSGIIPLTFMDVPLLNTSSCYPFLWKTVACTLQIRPCHPKGHRNAICKADCVDLLTKCLDTSRLQDPKQTPASLCEMIGIENETQSGCISIKHYMTEEATDPETGHPALQPYPVLNRVSQPCQPNPCPSEEICLVNHECKQGQACFPFQCSAGCRLGDMSNMLLTVGTAIRVADPGKGLNCHLTCVCQPNGLVDECKSLPCINNHSCYLENHKIEHNTKFTLECKECLCFSGEITCSLHETCKSKNEQLEKESSCSCRDNYNPVCGINGRTYPNPCSGRCNGLREDQFTLRSCFMSDPCLPNPCSNPEERCIVKRRVCLSLTNELACDQFVCLNINSDCVHFSGQPVCDTLGDEHPNLCWLQRKGRTLAYEGKCKLHCSHSGPVCGYNGETYSNECQALADFAPVDYFGVCSYNNAATEPHFCAQTKCGRKVSSNTCHSLIHLTGNCCPICGAALRILFSPQLAAKYLQAVGSVDRSVSVKTLASQLYQMVGTSECEAFSYLSLEGDVVVLFLPAKQDSLQIDACLAEANRIKTLIEDSSPLFTTTVPLSLLNKASAISSETVPSGSPPSAARTDPNSPSLLLHLLLLFPLVTFLVTELHSSSFVAY